jgi:hypothetical protein
MGEFMAWIIGWDLVLEYAVGAATVGISWSRYLGRFLEGFGVHLPSDLMAGPWDGGIINLPAVFIIVLMSLLLMKGTKESAFVNSIIVVVKIAAFFADKRKDGAPPAQQRFAIFALNRIGGKPPSQFSGLIVQQSDADVPLHTVQCAAFSAAGAEGTHR